MFVSPFLKVILLVQTFSHTVEEKAKWIFNKLKGKKQI